MRIACLLKVRLFIFSGSISNEHAHLINIAIDRLRITVSKSLITH